MSITVWIQRYPNADVTDYYLDIILKAYSHKKMRTVNFKTWNEVEYHKGDIVFVSDIIQACYALLHRYQYAIWFQGVMPEESYLRNHQRLRFFILSALEKISLKKSVFKIFVSEAMKQHYEHKYDVKIEHDYYIMPCGNEVFHKEQFMDKDNVFCYAGSINKWQCVEETIALYKKIEDKDPTSKLLLLVRDKEDAKKLVNQYGIQNYEIDFVPVSELKDRIREAKYGFILRKNLTVNAVATPTKLSTYIANGIIPIISESLDGLDTVLKDTPYVIRLKSDVDDESILRFMKKKIDNKELMDSYQSLYMKYYDEGQHITNLSLLLPTKIG